MYRNQSYHIYYALDLILMIDSSLSACYHRSYRPAEIPSAGWLASPDSISTRFKYVRHTATQALSPLIAFGMAQRHVFAGTNRQASDNVSIRPDISQHERRSTHERSNRDPAGRGPAIGQRHPRRGFHRADRPARRPAPRRRGAARPSPRRGLRPRRTTRSTPPARSRSLWTSHARPATAARRSGTSAAATSTASASASRSSSGPDDAQQRRAADRPAPADRPDRAAL